MFFLINILVNMTEVAIKIYKIMQLYIAHYLPSSC